MNNKENERVKAYWHDAVEELFANPKKTTKQVAEERQMNAHSLGAYILNHYRERWEEFCREERKSMKGNRPAMKEKYEAAVAYIKQHPEEILGSVAYRFDIYSTTPMTKYIRRHYPDLLPWRMEWNKAKTAAKHGRIKRPNIGKERECSVGNHEAWRAGHLQDLDAPVVPFAERIEAMQKRLNDIRDGRGDTFSPGDLSLLKVTPGGYSVKEWKKKQHTLDVIKRRMEEVKRIRGRG